MDDESAVLADGDDLCLVEGDAEDALGVAGRELADERVRLAIPDLRRSTTASAVYHPL